MEIHRNVKIEEGSDTEIGFSSGPRTTDAVPRFSQEELSEGLGEWRPRIEHLFSAFREVDAQEDAGLGDDQAAEEEGLIGLS